MKLSVCMNKIALNLHCGSMNGYKAGAKGVQNIE